jgi:hypothetical protein
MFRGEGGGISGISRNPEGPAMTRRRTLVFRSVIAAAMPGVVVVTPVDFLLVPMLFVIRMAIRWTRGTAAGWAVPGAVGVAVVMAAAFAPVETVYDRAKAYRGAVPKREMILVELSDPYEHGLPKPTISYSLAFPEGWDDRVVRFPSLEPTIGEFIAAIESQGGLEHRFGSCGNGWTILWGHDNITYLSLHAPGR